MIMPVGCQKKIYYVKKTNSEYFEEAYLILKKDLPKKPDSALSGDLAKEAQRIVREVGRSFVPAKKAPYLGRIGAFALGAASSSVIIGTVAWITSL